LGPRTPPFVSSETRLSLAFIVSDADATRSVVTAVGRNEGVVGRGQSSVIANVIGVILRQQWRDVDVTDTVGQYVTAGVTQWTSGGQLAVGA